MYDELEIAITPHGCGSDLHKTVMQAYTSFHELSKLQTGNNFICKNARHILSGGCSKQHAELSGGLSNFGMTSTKSIV